MGSFYWFCRQISSSRFATTRVQTGPVRKWNIYCLLDGARELRLSPTNRWIQYFRLPLLQLIKVASNQVSHTFCLAVWLQDFLVYSSDKRLSTSTVIIKQKWRAIATIYQAAAASLTRNSTKSWLRSNRDSKKKRMILILVALYLSG